MTELSIGQKVRISAGSGVDSNKIVTIINPKQIKTDGRAIPINVVGNHYKPVDWQRECAIQYEDGKLGTMFKNRLIPLQQESYKKMNYRDSFGKKLGARKDIKSLIPEGVTLKEFYKGVAIEKESVGNELFAAKLAGDNLKTDPEYYSKIHGDDDIESCGEDVDTSGEEYDDNGGLPKMGGALAVPHLGQPIKFGKIVQVGAEFGHGPANGEVSGMTSCNSGGLKVTQNGDKEQLTAGGKPVDSSIASKTVGGQVVPGEGQKQGGLNSKGHIAGTSKLDEGKQKVRKIVKEVLKEITFDKKTGKWVKLNEEVVKMTMGKSYKVVQPRQYKVMDDDTARNNQFEPEISEMIDDEEECMMNERYVELANANRNLSESELHELKTLRERIDYIQENKKNWIQNAVNPAHKGDCTPMSKPSCTPHKKALAKRFKSGDLEENRCEDYPCCGHEGGNCPTKNTDGTETHSCASCGATLPSNSHSSLCKACLRRGMERGDGESSGEIYGDVFEDSVSDEPNHELSNWGAQYTVRDGSTQIEVPGKVNRSRQIQKSPRVNENEDEVSFKNGDKVRFTQQYGGGRNGEVFTLTQWDGKRGRVSDKDDRGWNVRANQILHADADDEEELSENGNVVDAPENIGHKGQQGFLEWECAKCHHEIMAKEQPEPIKWKDGHVCHFIRKDDTSMEEAGGQGVQHRSYRTIDDAPQNPKARWSDEVTEGNTKKMSQVAKTIKKGMKPKTVKPKSSKSKKK